MTEEKLVLELPEKVLKKQKGYYIGEDIIDFIKDEAQRLSEPFAPVSENTVLTAIVNFYRTHRTEG
jgi:hypothetical protein